MVMAPIALSVAAVGARCRLHVAPAARAREVPSCCAGIPASLIRGHGLPYSSAGLTPRAALRNSGHRGSLLLTRAAIGGGGPAGGGGAGGAGGRHGGNSGGGGSRPFRPPFSWGIGALVLGVAYSLAAPHVPRAVAVSRTLSDACMNACGVPSERPAAKLVIHMRTSVL